MALEKKRTLLLLLTLSFSLTLNVYYSFFPTSYGTTTTTTSSTSTTRSRFDGSSNPSNSTTGNIGSRSHDHQQDGSIILHYEQQDYQPFNETNPYSSSWCPRATCHNSPLCAPCIRRFLFILSTGRSGSTSLLKMMNKLPNIQLSGENRNELFYANRLVRNLKFSTAFNFEEGNKDGAWLHNPIPTQAMACVMQKLMTTIDPPPHDVLINLNTPDHPSLEEYERSKILGAKMIRIQVGDWDPEDEAVEYFQENFPCARYIVNYSSDIQRQVKSRLNLKWGPDDYETQKKTLMKENEFLKNFARLMGPDRAQLIDMTEWTRDVSILNNILKWMGYRKCRFQNILHDNDLKFEPDSTVPNISKKCHYPHHSVLLMSQI
eukprot:CAMPEP_0176483664 /NCGR_PEP_ID=MMETSP0200_2-20121128/4039_1 /TAXON_ID=947934 /ORGANISM="Chaetoceros sp., Strain GSL56" /LENGTH=375 /DNA_ID=CAMNT_0017880081 /DNA_START=234 /DNA_END=1364 /DNA_ORIENTATION=-